MSSWPRRCPVERDDRHGRAPPRPGVRSPSATFGWSVNRRSRAPDDSLPQQTGWGRVYLAYPLERTSVEDGRVRNPGSPRCRPDGRTGPRGQACDLVKR
jgi:hypothetical protein